MQLNLNCMLTIYNSEIMTKADCLILQHSLNDQVTWSNTSQLIISFKNICSKRM